MSHRFKKKNNYLWILKILFKKFSKMYVYSIDYKLFQIKFTQDIGIHKNFLIS